MATVGFGRLLAESFKELIVPVILLVAFTAVVISISQPAPMDIFYILE